MLPSGPASEIERKISTSTPVTIDFLKKLKEPNHCFFVGPLLRIFFENNWKFKRTVLLKEVI